MSKNVSFVKNLCCFVACCSLFVACVPRQQVSKTQALTQSHETNQDSTIKVLKAFIVEQFRLHAASSESTNATGTRSITEVTTEFNDSTGNAKKQRTLNISEQFGKKTEKQTDVTADRNTYITVVDSLFNMQTSRIDSLENKIEQITEKTGLTKFQSYLLVSGVIGNILILILIIFVIIKKVVLKK